MNRPFVQNTSLGVLAGAVLLTIATSPLWTVMLVKRHAAQIVEDSIHGLTASSLADVNISDGFVGLSIAVNTADPTVRDRNLAEVSALAKSTDSQLKLYEETINEPSEQSGYARLVELRGKYRTTRDQVIELMRQSHEAEARQVFQASALPQFVAYKDAIDRLVQQDAAEARERGSEIMHLCNSIMILQGVLLVFFFIYAFFVPLMTFFERVATRHDFVSDP